MYPILAALVLGATPGPLTAAAPTADRGEARTGPPLAHAFAVTHAGPAGIVTITGVETGCGCLKPTVSRSDLAPGESAEVLLTVNTLTQPPGPNAWKAVVRYRVAVPGAAPPAVDAGEALELRLTATLVREVSVTPPSVAFSTTTAASQTLVVADTREKPLTVVAASATNPKLGVTVRPRAGAGQPVDLAVTADFPAGEAEEIVTLVTDDPACRELRVPVKVSKRTAASVAAFPEALEIRFARGAAEASGLVQVRKPGGGEVAVAGVDGGHPAVKPRWAAAAGPVATVRVVVDAAAATGAGGSTVTIHLQGGEAVTVPVTWVLPVASPP